MITKPMLAVDAGDVTKLRYPIAATPKLDGIRCIKVDGKALSRSLKPIPNHHIRTWIEEYCPDGFDGEIMCPGKTFSETASAVMSRDGEPEFRYFVFDFVGRNLAEPYTSRTYCLEDLAQSGALPEFVRRVMPVRICNPEELAAFEARCLEQGHEGVILRDPYGPYKFGRSTLKEGYLLKLKRFEDSEAEIVGFEELMINTNPQEKNELGHSGRSSHKAGLVPGKTLGTLLVRDLKTGIEFGIGTGFNDAMRDAIWRNQATDLGRIVTYRFQPHGVKDKPRCPSFKWFRAPEDMS